MNVKGALTVLALACFPVSLIFIGIGGLQNSAENKALGDFIVKQCAATRQNHEAAVNNRATVIALTHSVKLHAEVQTPKPIPTLSACQSLR